MFFLKWHEAIYSSVVLLLIVPFPLLNTKQTFHSWCRKHLTFSFHVWTSLDLKQFNSWDKECFVCFCVSVSNYKVQNVLQINLNNKHNGFRLFKERRKERRKMFSFVLQSDERRARGWDGQQHPGSVQHGGQSPQHGTRSKAQRTFTSCKVYVHSGAARICLKGGVANHFQ